MDKVSCQYFALCCIVCTEQTTVLKCKSSVNVCVVQMATLIPLKSPKNTRQCGKRNSAVPLT